MFASALPDRIGGVRASLSDVDAVPVPTSGPGKPAPSGRMSAPPAGSTWVHRFTRSRSACEQPLLTVARARRGRTPAEIAVCGVDAQPHFASIPQTAITPVGTTSGKVLARPGASPTR